MFNILFSNIEIIFNLVTSAMCHWVVMLVGVLLNFRLLVCFVQRQGVLELTGWFNSLNILSFLFSEDLILTLIIVALICIALFFPTNFLFFTLYICNLNQYLLIFFFKI